MITTDQNRTEMFGFYQFAGKSTCFLGPMLISIILYFSNNQRLAMIMVNIFFVSSFYLLIKTDLMKFLSCINDNDNEYEYEPSLKASSSYNQ